MALVIFANQMMMAFAGALFFLDLHNLRCAWSSTKTRSITKELYCEGHYYTNPNECNQDKAKVITINLQGSTNG